MKPRRTEDANLQILLELREALVIILRFAIEDLARMRQLREDTQEQILKIDRRYGDIQRWHRSGVGSGKSDGPE